MTANYVARETGWDLHGWAQGDRATNDHFAPLQTYEVRLDELLRGIRSLGFGAVGGEAEEHLVQLDVVQHLCAEILFY